MQRALLTILTMLVLMSTQHGAHAQTTWYVDDDCAAPGAGTEIDPFCTIQDGVNASSDGDTVLVAAGSYTGDGNRDISLFGKTITLTSTDGPNSTVMDIEGGPKSIHRGFFLIHGETNEAVIDGFTIINGYLIGDTGGPGFGGGGGGAAIFIRESSPVIRNCIVEDNTSMALSPPFPFDGLGAGIYVAGSSNAIIEDCVIVNNFAERLGGGVMYIGDDDSDLIVRNCLIRGNSASNGGGLRTSGGGSSKITNTTIVNNSAVFSGGGIHNSQSEALLSNCTLRGNVTDSSGPQIFVQGPALTIEYSNVQGGLEDVAECCNAKIIWGPGMIDADPFFFDPESGDFRFRHGSPCIDSGNNLAVPEEVVTDLDGGPRFLDDPNTRDTGNPDGINPIVDMGPYEFDHQDCNNNDTPDTTDLADGTSADCNANEIPDECEIDCNGNDQPDSCDISAGASGDCNGNEVPDECDIGSGVSQDCNQNAIPDACDLDSGTSQDCGGEGIPDECPENPGPVITAQPVSQQVQPGELGFFSVGADGVLLEYQWRKDGEDLQDDGRILGSESATLLIFDVVPGDEGSYDCVVTDFFGACALSNPATLTVSAACPADVNDDGLVGPVDLAMLLAAWGPCPDPEACPADLNADGAVGPIDLAMLLAAWGPCP